MPNPYFKFKQFTVYHNRCAMKVATDSCLFGAWCAADLQQKATAEQILDIGTGTGLLALMVAQKNTTATIDAVEITEQAYAQAKDNVAVSYWNKIITLHHADIKNFGFTKKYDAIISNPPFYEADIKSTNQLKNVALHSAALLLDELLEVIKQQLATTGSFYLLLPYKRIKEIEKLIKNQNLFIYQKLLVKQTPTHPPFRIIVKGGLQQPHNVQEQELTINNSDRTYTAAFVDLLKDYYLYL